MFGLKSPSLGFGDMTVRQRQSYIDRMSAFSE
jgi:hypothetical protein